MSISESGQYDLLDRLAEEFAARFRRGERPALKEYTDRYPELAEEIRELFPAMVQVEQAEGGRQGQDVDQTGDARTANPPLSQIGDYRILREIGRGGMGVVYEAEQISLGRRVALKVLPRQVSGDRMIQERFRREARAAARLHHTNIVPVYEVGQDGDVRFYAMQFIQGQGLDLIITELRQLRDRARSEPKIKAASPGQSLRPHSGRSGQGIEAPTVAEGVEVGAVLQSILTGRFDPGGRGPELAGASPSVLARALAGVVATPSGTGTESRAARIRARTDAHRDRECDRGRRNRPKIGASVPTRLVTVSLPVVQLGDPARWDPALVGRVGSAPVLPQPGSDRPAGRRGAGLRPCRRDRAPRYQAVELAAGHRRRGLDRRLRPGQGGGRGADPERGHPGHAPLHVPRAVPGRRGCSGRRLRAGVDPLRAADAPRGIRLVGPAQADRADQDRGAAAAAGGRCPDSAGPGDDRLEGDREGPEGAVPDRPRRWARTWGGSSPMSRSGPARSARPSDTGGGPGATRDRGPGRGADGGADRDDRGLDGGRDVLPEPCRK